MMTVKMVRILHMTNTIFKRFATCTLIELTMMRITKSESKKYEDGSLKVDVQREMIAIILTNSSDGS
jgi:hypothetical protein